MGTLSAGCVRLCPGTVVTCSARLPPAPTLHWRVISVALCHALLFPCLMEKKPVCVREVLAQAGQLLMDLGLLPPLVVLGTGMALG